MQPLHAPGIAAGEKAYVWEVPKNLPENEFIKSRLAVEEHAACECLRDYIVQTPMRRFIMNVLISYDGAMEKNQVHFNLLSRES